MKKLKLIELSVIVIMLFGCVSVKSIPYETNPRDPKPDNFPIEIFDSKDLTMPYKIIGIVQADAGKKHSVADVLQKFRSLARRMGGDALIDLTNQPIGTGIPTSKGGIVYSGHVRELWQAKVIVWQSSNY